MSVLIFDGADGEEILRRQVNPNHFKPGSTTELDRSAFTPRYNSDEPDGRMSHLRGSVDAREAWRRFTEDHGKQSAGTWPMKVDVALGLGLTCGDDSALEDRPDDHAFVEVLRDPRESRRHATLQLAKWSSAAGPLFTPSDNGGQQEEPSEVAEQDQSENV